MDLYVDVCLFNNNTKNETKDLPNLEENVLDTLIWGSVYTWLVIIIGLVIQCFSKKTKNLNRFIHKQHIYCGVIHLSLLNLYYIVSECYTWLLYEQITFFSLMTPVWTACIAWKMFLNIFLFVNGEDMYTKKGILKFVTISIGIIIMYEELIIVLFNLMYCFVPDVDHVVVPAVRMTSILIIMALTWEIFLVTLFYSLIPSKVNRKLSFSYILHLFLLQVSDSILAGFRIDVWKQQADGYRSNLSTILLCVRLNLEILWFLVVPYIKLPIYGINAVV